MMRNHLLLILCLQVTTLYTAPHQLQYQSQISLQPAQEELLQQQLFALQQLQQLQNLQMMNEYNNFYPSAVQRTNTPLMIILPESQVNDITHPNHELLKHKNANKDVNDHEIINEDLDSVVVEAESTADPKPEPEPKKVILLIPNTRTFSLGGIISAIPFLPIEINVPDSISWIYDGISGIISGIGQRWPIKRPAHKPTEDNNAQMQDNNVRLLIKRLQNRNQNVRTPILMLPDVAQVYPIPMQM